MTTYKLKLLGRASESVHAKYVQKFEMHENNVLFFCDFSEFDIPLATVFTTVEDMEGCDYFIGKAVLKSVSQGFFLPFDMIPKGHKTICVFHFLLDLPAVIQGLAVINDWYESREYLILQ